MTVNAQMLNRKAGLAALVAAVLVSACGSKNEIQRSDLESLVFDQNAQNVAILLGSDGGNLDGVPVDIRNLKSLFGDASNGFNFKIQAEERHASVRQAVQMIKQGAAEVGDRGTLLIYYSGHGAQGSGCMAFTDNCVTFSTFAKAIQEVRTSPIKRLLFFSDSCFAGQLVVGNSAIISSTGATGMQLDEYEGSSVEQQSLFNASNDFYTSVASMNTAASARGFEKTLFEQALTVGASRPDETSADLGSMGGGFTSSLKQVFQQIKGSPSTTIGDFIEQTKKKTQQHGQTPTYRAFPSDVVLKDTVFGTGNNGPVNVQAQTINVALAEAANDNGTIWSAADVSIASMSICNGDAALCAAGRDDVVLVKANVTSPTSSTRAFFHTPTTVAFGNSTYMTLQGKDATGKIVTKRTVRIAKQ